MPGFDSYAFGGGFDGGIETSDRPVFSRYNARRGQIVRLQREFYHAAVLMDPYFVEKVELHKVEFDASNPTSTLVATIDSPDITKDSEGKFHVDYTIPLDMETNFIYFDVWYFQANSTSSIEPDASSQFKVYEDQWFTQDGSTNYKYQLFPDIKSFTKGEKRNIELQIVPLPLYNTSQALDDLILPISGVSTKIETTKGELILDWTNTITKNTANKAYVTIDTNLPEFRKGVYYYWVRLELPNSEIIISQKFAFNII